MRILVLANSDVGLFNFRFELIERLVKDGHSVFISCPFGERIRAFQALGVEYYDTKINRHGMNLLEDLKLLKSYKTIIKKIQPKVVLSYTIKPNIYGAIAARKYKVPFVANITGLGTAVENKGLKQKICISLYKYAFKKVKTVFFQNAENESFFAKHKIAVGKHALLPGSGVNLYKYCLQPYPSINDPIRFVFVGRIMKEKGIDYFLSAAERIKKDIQNIEFHVCGFIENEYKGNLQNFVDKQIVIYHGMVKDMTEIYRQMHCTVFPSYYPEGISNVLLETAASGRPIITTDRAGCREAVNDGVNGFIVKTHSQEELDSSILRFIDLPYEQKNEFGIESRKKIEKEFDRNIVIDKYLSIIEEIAND